MSASVIARKRAEYSRSLESDLNRMVEQLMSMPSVHRVVLFGSYAAGRRDLFTDLDILVVMDSDLDFVTRTAVLYQTLQPTVDLDLIVYTPEEFERQRDSSYIRHALNYGKVLYEK